METDYRNFSPKEGVMKINVKLPLINRNKGKKQVFNIQQSAHILFMQHFLTLECLCNKLERFLILYIFRQLHYTCNSSIPNCCTILLTIS
jgi:hypothetical protein